MAIQQGGMFGPTPEEIQQALLQQQGADDWQQATAWGRGNLANQISTAGFMGGSMLGRGLESLGRGAGVLPEDPRLAEAKKMMEIKKAIMSQGIDPQDIDNFYPALIEQLYKGGMIDKATQLQKDYQTLSNQQDAIQTRKEAALLRQREAAMPGLQYIKALLPSLQKNPENAHAIAKYRASITEENPTGDLSILAEMESKIAGVKVRHVGEDGPTGLPVYQNEDGSDAAWYRDPKTGEKRLSLSGLRPKNTTVSLSQNPTFQLGDKVTSIVGAYNDNSKIARQLYDDAISAQQLLNEASQSNNSVAWEQARTLLAKAVGQGRLSNEDIRRTGNDPRIIQGALNWINSKTVGVPNKDIISQMYVVAKILQQQGADRFNVVSRQHRRLALAANKDLKESDLDSVFPEIKDLQPNRVRTDEELFKQYDLTPPKQGK